ncbi:MAG: LysE family translocator, partial [Desulfobacteraceae bacterium]
MALWSAGLVYGLSAGFSPGPLMALVISQTLKHGIREGTKVAMAPLITDLPIILVSLLVLTRLTDFKMVLGVISIIGGIFVAYLAYGNFRPPRLEEDAGRVAPQSLAKGVAANALSPHPYLFWLTVGGPVIVRGWSESPLGPLAFLMPFFACLVGAKILTAWITGRSRHWLSGPVYRGILIVLGTLLAVF